MRFCICYFILGLSIQSRQAIKVYPNPTEGILYVENLVEQPLSLQLLDEAGKSAVALKQDSYADIYMLNTDGLSSGVYYLLAVDEGGEVVAREKIVVGE